MGTMPINFYEPSNAFYSGGDCNFKWRMVIVCKSDELTKQKTVGDLSLAS